MLRGPGWILRRERDRRGWTVDEVAAVLRDVGRRLGVRVDDIDGDTRPVGGASDCGADEFKP